MSKTLSTKPEPKDQISEDFCKRIVDFTSRYVDIVAIYIFGSVATAKNRSGSDIDVAIMVRGQVKGMERVQLETSLSNFLGKDVDIIIFGEATPLLQHQILKYGCLIYYVHKDCYNIKGQRKKINLNLNYEDSLTLADDDINENWKIYREKYLEGRFP